MTILIPDVCPECGKPAYVEKTAEYGYVGYELKCRDCQKHFWFDEYGNLECVIKQHVMDQIIAGDLIMTVFDDPLRDKDFNKLTLTEDGDVLEHFCVLTDVISNHGINVIHNDYEYNDADDGFVYFSTEGYHTPKFSMRFLREIEERWRYEDEW